VGLPDAVVREARQRVKSAIRNSGFEFPDKKQIIVNLSPADIKKEGMGFDLPIALSILGATGQIDNVLLEDYIAIGELGLQGEIKPIEGILAIALGSKIKKLIVPVENALEASLSGLDIYPVTHLTQTINGLYQPMRINTEELLINEQLEIDFAEIKGQALARRAAEIACAGGHNLLLIGSPGAGKTMIARRIPTILPSLSLSECLETTKIYSIRGLLSAEIPLICSRPFRSPHHTSSYAALAGGGTMPKPGEISLAHNGVLFLDEFPEFDRRAIETLREPVESGKLTVSRVAGSLTFPASFMLVIAMNWCPCGYLRDRIKSCVCDEGQIRKYWDKMSGALLDRVDLGVEVKRLSKADLSNKSLSESSGDIRNRVTKARDKQLSRGTLNSKIAIAKISEMTDEAMSLLLEATERLPLSGRGYDRCIRVSRTIADLQSKDIIELEDIAEALQYKIEPPL
jgi:magnesium chelatase family protein